MLLNSEFRRSTGKKRDFIMPDHSTIILLFWPCHTASTLPVTSPRQRKTIALPSYLLSQAAFNTWYSLLRCGGIKLKLTCQVSSQVRVLHVAQQSALSTWRPPHPIAAHSVIRFLRWKRLPRSIIRLPPLLSCRLLLCMKSALPGLSLAQLF